MPTVCEPWPGKRKAMREGELVIKYARVGAGALTCPGGEAPTAFSSQRQKAGRASRASPDEGVWGYVFLAIGSRRDNHAQFGQLTLNRFVHFALREFRRHSHRVLDGIRIRRSVRDDAYAFNAQQRRAPILGVFQHLFE